MSYVREVAVPGAKLVVEAAGDDGVPLLLVHGFAADRRSWDGVWTILSKSRQVIRYDLRGSGASVPTSDQQFRHSLDLKGLLEELMIEQCYVAGVSLGGSIALNFALDHPERVLGLLLVSPSITAWEWSAEWRERWDAIVNLARRGNIAAAKHEWLLHPLFETTRAIPPAAQKLEQALQQYSGADWLEDSREEAALPDLERLPWLDIPTLLLTGTADLPDFRAVADIIEALAPKVQRIQYEGSGHMLQLERPLEVASDMLAFLS